MSYRVINGDSAQELRPLETNSVDAVITDPPYGIEFLAKEWDSNTGAVEIWQECLRVLKPGGFLLAFSAARTYHQLATNIESVGFEIRDQIMWIYASGFPKAQDIGKSIQKRQGVEVYEEIIQPKNEGMGTAYNDKAYRYNEDNKNETVVRNRAVATSPEAVKWAGWKTALKPAHEPICMARKPFKGSTIDNVLEHGTGALNIDATRIAYTDNMATAKSKIVQRKIKGYEDTLGYKETHFVVNEQGRYPSNVMGEIPDYQKYFYCPKVSRAERHCGFEQNNIPTGNNIGDGVYAPGTPGSLDHIATSNGGFLGTDGDWASEHWNGDKGNKNNDTVISTEHMIQAMGGKLINNNRVWTPDLGEFYIHGLREEYIKWCEKNNKATGSMGNNHPTVKPVALMRYLIKLVTPEGGSVLDPFTGSGSTGMAAVEASMSFTGCELDPNYVAIANKRIEAWYTRTQPDNNFKDLFDATE